MQRDIISSEILYTMTKRQLLLVAKRGASLVTLANVLSIAIAREDLDVSSAIVKKLVRLDRSELITERVCHSRDDGTFQQCSKEFRDSFMRLLEFESPGLAKNVVSMLAD